MPSLDEILAALSRHPGVERVVLLGRDGLVVRHLGSGPPHEEIVAAAVPSILAACDGFASATARGVTRTAVVEFSEAVLIAVPVSADLLLALLLRPATGFAPLLREIRAHRDRLAELL